MIRPFKYYLLGGSILLPDYIFRAFYYALRTKGFVILAGKSGTGKTKIFEYLSNNCTDEKRKGCPIWIDDYLAKERKKYPREMEKIINKIVNDLKSNPIMLKESLEKGGDDLFKYLNSNSKVNKKIKEIIANILSRPDKPVDPAKLDLSTYDLETHYAIADFFKSTLSYIENELKSRVSKGKVKPVYANMFLNFIQEINDEIGSGPDKSKFKLYKIYHHNIEIFSNPPFHNSEEHLRAIIKQLESHGSTVLKSNYLADNLPCTTDFIRYLLTGDYSRIETDPVKNLIKGFIIAFIIELICENSQKDPPLVKDIIQGLIFDKGVEVLKSLILCPLKFRKLFIPIGPYFTDSHVLLGYYNPVSGVYHKTDFLEFIIKALREYIENPLDANPYVVLLDEMNLARVEYYFAEFLSVLESKVIEDESEVSDEMLNEIKKIVELEDIDKKSLVGIRSKPVPLSNPGDSALPSKLYIPPNLYFVGTVNIDETTYTLSPKVLDRAYVIEFDFDLNDFLSVVKNENYDLPTICVAKFIRLEGGKKYKYIINYNDLKDDVKKLENSDLELLELLELLKDIFNILKKHEFEFAARTFNEIIGFILNYVSEASGEKFSKHEAIDLAIKLKILPRLHGPRQRLERPLIELLRKLLDKPFSTDPAADYITEIPDPAADYITEIPEFKLIEDKGETQTDFELLEDEGETLTDFELIEDKGETLTDFEYRYEFTVKIGENSYTYKTKYPHSVRKILTMLYRLNVFGYATFM